MVKGGSDVCIISYGPIMGMAFAVAAKIEQERGHSVAVVSAHTLKPLDTTGIADLLRRFKTVVVIEEHSEHGGLGAQVKQIAWEVKAGCDLSTFGLKDEFIHVFGSQRDLWEAHGLSVDSILKQVGAA
jgi:transketolase